LLTAELRTGPAHGSVFFHDNGSFEYTADDGYRGMDQFTYVAGDSLATSNEAVVVIQVGAPKVGIRLEVTDLDGQPVSEVAAGDPLLLRAWVKDLRDDTHSSRGVFAAYLDVLFDPELVMPVLDGVLPLGFEIYFGPSYYDPGSGDALTPGVVNEVGSYQAAFEPLGPEEQLLFEMPFDIAGPRAADDAYDVSYKSSANLLDVLTNDRQLQWSTDFVADPADVSPNSDTLLFEPPVVVPVEDIEYSDTSVSLKNDDTLTIVAVGSVSAGGSVLISSDGQHVIYAPAPGYLGTETFVYTVSDERGRLADATVTVDVIRSWQNVRNPLDVNSDMRIEPLDALLVINDLNLNGAGQLAGPPIGPPFFDVNGDGFISPIDALLIINYLNRQSESQLPGEGEFGRDGEGESAVAVREVLAIPAPLTSMVAVAKPDTPGEDGVRTDENDLDDPLRDVDALGPLVENAVDCVLSHQSDSITRGIGAHGSRPLPSLDEVIDSLVDDR
jgi:hypothetical protein